MDDSACIDPARADHAAFAAQHTVCERFFSRVVVSASDEVLNLPEAERRELTCCAGGRTTSAADAQECGPFASDESVAQRGVDLV